MALVCEDLARHGVVLVPIADNDPIGSGSALLINRAQVAIASIAFVWSIPGRNGRPLPHSFSPGTNPSVLLPFGLDDRMGKVHAYRNTILPGSKRLMKSDGSLLGDNTDVRPPAADELWHGGFVSMGGGSRRDVAEPLKLTLDGVFFVDGGFAGPNCLYSWEATVSAAEGHLKCAALAREVRSKRTPLDEFFARVQTLTGQTDDGRMPPPLHLPNLESPAPVGRYQLQMVGRRVLDMRKRLGDEGAMAQVEAWADAPVPQFYKL